MNAYVGVLDHPYFAVTKRRRHVQHSESAARHVHARRVAREARHADAERDRRREGNEVDANFTFKAAGRERISNTRLLGFWAPGFSGTREPGVQKPEAQNPESGSASPMWLHRYAKFVSAATVLLIVAGGLVTSTGSGLAVPDWPTSYGWNMFTFPMKHMVGGIFYEHGHRLIASGVGFLTIILALWLWRAEPRRWMRMLGFAALGAVCLQGLLGGITVLYFLPTAVSTAHAGLAQIFFCLTIAISLFTSRGWTDGPSDPVDDRDASPRRRDDDGSHLSAGHRRRNHAPLRRRTGHSGFSARLRRALSRLSGRRRSRSITRTAWARSS